MKDPAEKKRLAPAHLQSGASLEQKQSKNNEAIEQLSLSPQPRLRERPLPRQPSNRHSALLP